MNINDLMNNIVNDKTMKTLLNMCQQFSDLPTLKKDDFSKEDTVLINLDLLNGFLREGALSSAKVNKITPDVVRVNELFKGYQKIFIKDSHNKDSIEFESYPPHCIEDSKENQIIDELYDYVQDDESEVMNKNSTNAFICENFIEYIMELIEEETIEGMKFIVIGDVTDICVMDFSSTLKCYLNEYGINADVYVVTTCVETFDLEATNHDSDLMNLFALYSMNSRGVKIIRDII